MKKMNKKRHKVTFYFSEVVESDTQHDAMYIAYSKFLNWFNSEKPSISLSKFPYTIEKI